MPLIVLAAGQSVEQDTLWQDAQEQLARDSSNAKLTIASGSGHYIHWEQPTLVVDAIRQVVEAARANQQLKP